MAYIRFNPGFSRHPKRIKSGPVSSWLWACSVDYCGEFLTDGFIEDGAVPGLVPSLVGGALKRCIANLLAVGSWERVNGGYQVHDYLKYNLSKAQVQADQQAGRKRYDRWLTQRRHDESASNAVDHLPTNAVSDTPTPLPTPLPTRLQRCSQSSQSSQTTEATTSKGTVALATGSNGDDPETEAKRRATLAILHRAFPELRPVQPVQAMTPRPEEPHP